MVRAVTDPPTTAASTPPATAPGLLRPAPTRGGRIIGIDVARLLAVIGMVMVHFGPTGASQPEGLAGELYGLAHGRASILFALLAGIGAALLAGDLSPSRVRSTRWRLAYRAAVLLPLGLVLQPLDHGVLVILQYYAVYFLIAALAVRLPDVALLGSAAATALLSPVPLLAAWHRWPEWFDHGATELGDPAAVIVRQLLLSGSYPALTWAAPLLLGIWVGRRALQEPRIQARLMLVGLVVAIGAALLSWALQGWLGEPIAEPSWLQLASDTAHSQMPLWLIGGAGSACAVLGVALLAGQWLPRLIWPVAAAGQLAFTIYVGHLLVLARWTDLLRDPELAAAAANVAWFTLVVVVASAAWRALLPRGPLEVVLRLPWTVRDAFARR